MIPGISTEILEKTFTPFLIPSPKGLPKSDTAYISCVHSKKMASNGFGKTHTIFSWETTGNFGHYMVYWCGNINSQNMSPGRNNPYEIHKKPLNSENIRVWYVLSIYIFTKLMALNHQIWHYQDHQTWDHFIYSCKVYWRTVYTVTNRKKFTFWKLRYDGKLL